MTEPAPAAPPEDTRSQWTSIALWPLKGGMLPGTFALALAAFGMAMLDGGATQSSRDTRSYGQFACLVFAGAVLGVYARRTVMCTYPEERTVPWGKDELDDVSLPTAMGNFATVLILSFLPLCAWLVARGPIEPADWVNWLMLGATTAIGAALFPLGLAGSVVKGSVLGALPGPVLRMWRADPFAARVAAIAAFVSAGLIIASALLASHWLKHPLDVGLPSDYRNGEVPDVVSSSQRAVLFALRAAGFVAALSAARVAGLVVRDVPAIREAAQ